MPRPQVASTGRMARLIQLGRVEAVLACCLAVFVVAVHATVTDPGPAILLDLSACAAAAAYGRWPRSSGAALAVVLAIYLLVPPAWQTLGEYAAFIPILGSGMRAAAGFRLVLTLVYFPLVAGITWLDAPSPANALLGCVFWAVAFAVMWVIGSVFANAIAAQQQARLTDLLRQRQALARELHDTVAASLARVVMATERARMQGSVTDHDITAIFDSASASIQELRWIVQLLRDPVELENADLGRRTTLEAALAAAEHQLSRHGFPASLSIRGDLGLLTQPQASALAAASAEATNNILTHGNPEAPCAIMADVTDETAEIIFINGSGPSSPIRHDGPSFGLQGMRERLSSIGGDVWTEALPNQWITRLVLPLDSSDRPPGRAA